MHRLFALILFLCLFYLQAFGQTESIRADLASHTGKQKGMDWINLSRAYLMNGEDSIALIEGLNALEYARKQQDSSLIAQSMYYVHLAHPHRDSAFVWLERSELYSPAVKSSFQHAIREGLVIEYQDRALFKEALRLSRKNVNYAKGIADTLTLLKSVMELGFTYDRMKSYNEAIDTYEEVLPMALAYGDSIQYGRCLGLIGIAYDELRDFEKAKEYNRKAIAIFRQVGTVAAQQNLATWLSNLGNTLTKTLEYEEAEAALRESISLCETLNRTVGRTISNLNLGKLMMDMGRVQESRPFLMRGMRMANEYALVRFQSEGHNRLSEYYTREGNVDSAIYHLEQYHVLNDSLINEDKMRQLADLQVFYETEEQKAANISLSQKNDILSLEKGQQELYLFGSIGLLALTLLAGFIGYRNVKFKQESRMQKEVIYERERGMKALISSVEEERQRIAKDLHDGIGQQMTAMKLNWNSFRSSTKEQEKASSEKKMTELINLTAKDIRSVSHQMMPRALMELGLVPALRCMIEQTLGAAKIPHQFTVLGNERRVSQDIEIGIFRVTQELVNNIIKHANAKHVEVQLLFRENSLVLTLEDDGIGLGKDSKDGVGMLNIFNRISALSGEAHYEPGHDHGVVAIIKVPLT